LKNRGMGVKNVQGSPLGQEAVFGFEEQTLGSGG